MKKLLHVIIAAALCAGCSSMPDRAADLRTSTFYGVHVSVWDQTTQSPEFKTGLARDQRVLLSSNAVEKIQLLMNTHYDAKGFWKGQEAFTGIAVGADAVKQPSIARRVSAGTNVVQQTPELAK